MIQVSFRSALPSQVSAVGCALQLCVLHLCVLHLLEPLWCPSYVSYTRRLLPVICRDAACRYEGSWVKGVREGQGKCKYASGDAYDGAWSADMRAGLGSCNYENGDKYTGARRETAFAQGIHTGLGHRPMSWASATNARLERMSTPHRRHAVPCGGVRWPRAPLEGALSVQVGGRMTRGRGMAPAGLPTAASSAASGRPTPGCSPWLTLPSPSWVVLAW